MNTTTQKEFWFNTGVKPWMNSYRTKHQVERGGTIQIRFIVADVPEGSIFQFASPYDNVPSHNDKVKRFKIIDGGLLSEWAYFLIP